MIALFQDEHAKIHKNSRLEGSGLETWHKLQLAYDPIDPLTNLRLLQQLQDPAQCTSMDMLLSAIESWELLLKEYEDRSGDFPSVAQTQLCLRLLVQDTIRRHLHLHSTKFRSYELMREAITDYLSTRIDTHHSGELNYIGKVKKGGKLKEKGGKEKKGKDKKGEDKGKGDDGAPKCPH